MPSGAVLLPKELCYYKALPVHLSLALPVLRLLISIGRFKRQKTQYLPYFRVVKKKGMIRPRECIRSEVSVLTPRKSTLLGRAIFFCCQHLFCQVSSRGQHFFGLVCVRKPHICVTYLFFRVAASGWKIVPTGRRR